MWDKALTTTLAHEFKRCKTAFLIFEMLFLQLLTSKGNQHIKIECYNAYVDFAAHLYEFYVSCIKNDKRYSQNLTSKQTDEVIKIEVARLLKIRRERILHGDAPISENHISVYEITVPENFGENFRKVRNLRSHVNQQRVSFSLSKFYKDYHFFLSLIYEELIWLWDTDLPEAPKQDWGEIESFADAVLQTFRN